MRLLEVYSGTGSVGKPFKEAGHEVISIDIDPRFEPTICDDIFNIDYTTLPIPDVIWCSPPCCQYARCRTRGPPRNFKLADSLVLRALEIIEHFKTLNPDLIWFLENGHTTLLWGRDVAKNLTNYTVVDYCQYAGPGYRKRTRVAHSDKITWKPRALCDPKTCSQCVDRVHMLSAQQGPCLRKGRRRPTKEDKCSLDTLHGLPKMLTAEILEVCEAYFWEVIENDE